MFTPLIGKVVRAVVRLAGHGGSAYPGKVVERLDPGFMARALDQLPLGVVLVSGTNGKTTTTRMISSMLTDLGFRVFTNPTGSNFTRGVISALLDRVTLGGKLNADVAVLELDEAYAVRFVEQVLPRCSVLLNVLRDQLDRFGEIDATARLLGKVAAASTGTVVLNREDPRIAALADLVPEGTQVRYFGLDSALRRLFPDDDSMHATDVADPVIESPKSGRGEGNTRVSAAANTEPTEDPIQTPISTSGIMLDPDTLPADVTLVDVGERRAQYLIDGRRMYADMKLNGTYNLFNAAAALVAVRCVLRDAGRKVDDDRLITALGEVTAAFGRGEVINIKGTPLELVLVKNPMGFRMALAGSKPGDTHTMIVINDDYADGRDMSWLWDVDFTSLRDGGVSMVSGVRAADMALRLAYDQVPFTVTDADIAAAVRSFVAADPAVPKRVYCTYTAMLACRNALASIAEVSDAGL